MNGAELLVHELEAQGVEHLFGYPGGAIMPFYDALVGSSLKHVLVRHEQAAALAAGGYARSSGRVGVCVATSGPGASNLITGVADAYADSVPIVVITGQVPSALMGTDAFQEIDVFGLSLPVVKHSYVVRDAADLAFVVREAFAIAADGRPGPVWIDVPKDVLAAPTRVSPTLAPRVTAIPPPDELDLARAAALVARAHRPVVYVGGGVVASGAEQLLRDFVERLGLPCVCTLHALGVLPGDHPQFLGMLGMHGTKAANLAVQESDLLLCLGARFDDRATGKLDEFAPDAAVVHVDIDPAELDKLRRPTVALCGDVGEVLRRFDPPRPSIEEWRERIETWRTSTTPQGAPPASGAVDPTRLIAELTRRAGPEATVSTDVGQHQMWVAQYGRFHSARRHLSSGGLGTMGFGLPAGIGAQLARPGAPVFVISGDGSFLMNVQELATLNRYRLPVKIVVLDNSMLGLVRQWQDLFFDGRRSQVDLSDNPPFTAVAEAFGVPAFEVRRQDQVDDAITRLIETEGPLLCHVRIDAGQGVWPLVPSGRSNACMLEETPS